MIGNQLETLGWRQGSVVKTSDIKTVLNGTGAEVTDDLILIVASQSCDIANNNLSLDPYIEISLCRIIQIKDGNCSYNKNPRCLHTTIVEKKLDDSLFGEINISILAFERLSINKLVFSEIQPDSMRLLEKRSTDEYVAWLANRYSRPALPTKFNVLIDSADRGGKLRNAAKRANAHLSGIYVEIFPDREISDDEQYSVNLLGLVPPDQSADIISAETAIACYKTILEAAGMDVFTSVKTENEISLTVIKRYKRFYLDDLSFKADAPLPPNPFH